MKLHQEPLLGLDLFDELNKRFAVKDYYYLDKAISILEKYKNPSAFNKIKGYKIEDFSNVSDTDFTYIFSSLNDTFTSPVLKKVGMYSNTQNKGVDFLIENTEFTPQALVLLKKVMNEKKAPYLIFENDKFIYNGNKLNILSSGYVYSVLKIIYSILAGKSGEVSYEALYEEIAKLRKYKHASKAKIKEDFRKYITSNTDGLGLKIKLAEQNGERLISVNYGEGIYFNNGEKNPVNK